MEVGITLMELCYNLTTIALPRPTNDDSIRTCSFFLLYYIRSRAKLPFSKGNYFTSPYLCLFSTPPCRQQPTKKKTCENYMLFSGLNHFATSFLRLAYLLTHCTVTPFSVQKITEHNILKTLILTQRFKLKNFILDLFCLSWVIWHIIVKKTVQKSLIYSKS